MQNNINRKLSQFLTLILPMDWSKASNDLKRYFSNAGWLLFEKGIASITSFGVGIYVIRFLGPTDFGILSYALSFVSLFAGIAALGLDSIVIRDLVRNQGERDDLLGTSFVLKLMGALLVLIIISLVIAFAPKDKSTNWSIFFVSVASVFQSIYVIDYYFQSKVLSKYPVMVRCFSTVFSAGFKLVLIHMQASLIWFAFAVTMESFAIALGFIIVYMNNKLKVRWWKFKGGLALKLLRDSWPLILSGITISVYMRVDQVMIKSMLDTKSVGIYAIAVNLTEIWYFIPTIIIGSLFPALINARKNDYKLISERSPETS